MKQFSGYNNVQAFDGDFEILPLGGHVCVIKGVKFEEYAWGEMMIIALDIAEGEAAGFYQRQYDRNKATNPAYKWPGTYRQGVPKDDGSEKDNKAKSFFKGMISAIEKSNPGYTWNWDERSLHGKKVGAIFGQEEYLNMNNEIKLSTKCRALRSLDAIRKGVEIPEIRRLKGAPTTAVPAFPVGEDPAYNLPFDL